MAAERVLVLLDADGSCRHMLYSDIIAGRFPGFDLSRADERSPDGRVSYQIVKK